MLCLKTHTLWIKVAPRLQGGSARRLLALLALLVTFLEPGHTSHYKFKTWGWHNCAGNNLGSDKRWQGQQGQFLTEQPHISLIPPHGPNPPHSDWPRIPFFSILGLTATGEEYSVWLGTWLAFLSMYSECYCRFGLEWNTATRVTCP